MDEGKFTLTTEYSNTVIDVNTSAGGPMEIPQHVINGLAKVFLTVMREEYMQEHEKTN